MFSIILPTALVGLIFALVYLATRAGGTNNALMAMLTGVVGAFIGAGAYHMLGGHAFPAQPTFVSLISAAIGSILLLAAYRFIARPRF